MLLEFNRIQLFLYSSVAHMVLGFLVFFNGSTEVAPTGHCTIREPLSLLSRLWFYLMKLKLNFLTGFFVGLIPWRRPLLAAHGHHSSL